MDFIFPIMFFAMLIIFFVGFAKTISDQTKNQNNRNNQNHNQNNQADYSRNNNRIDSEAFNMFFGVDDEDGSTPVFTPHMSDDEVREYDRQTQEQRRAELKRRAHEMANAKSLRESVSSVIDDDKYNKPRHVVKPSFNGAHAHMETSMDGKFEECEPVNVVHYEKHNDMNQPQTESSNENSLSDIIPTSSDDLIKSIIFSEIIGKPKSMRK